MNEYGEENTIKEIIAYHGITGTKAQRLEKQLWDFLSAQFSAVSCYATPKEREVLGKLQDRVLVREIKHVIFPPTWSPEPPEAA